MSSSQGSVFIVGDDGLDQAAFIAGIRRMIVGNARLDSVVSAAVIRHIDFLLASSGVRNDDKRIDERAAQIEGGMRNVLDLGNSFATPNTGQFKKLIASARPEPAPEPERKRRKK
ncbi:hypothetical protein [Antrihabitans stalactiti]|uniref:Uncharacterized protein n=1 Tax=Antrihabitans stalactiti TaxID=2584121 RepID=A0A848K811_9NOCA|nr:hypothetical protein [Antrihabitans stalactiti]NMN93434.1 hypothetical protein [Antrihabitans stalactiti]